MGRSKEKNGFSRVKNALVAFSLFVGDDQGLISDISNLSGII